MIWWCLFPSLLLLSKPFAWICAQLSCHYWFTHCRPALIRLGWVLKGPIWNLRIWNILGNYVDVIILSLKFCWTDTEIGFPSTLLSLVSNTTWGKPSFFLLHLFVSIWLRWSFNDWAKAVEPSMAMAVQEQWSRNHSRQPESMRLVSSHQKKEQSGDIHFSMRVLHFSSKYCLLCNYSW